MKYIYFISGTVVTDMGVKNNVRTILESPKKLTTEADLCDVEYVVGKNFYGQRLTTMNLVFLHEAEDPTPRQPRQPRPTKEQP